MQPSQPQSNPYDFIVNPLKPPKKSMFAGASFGLKVALLVGGAVFIIIVLAVLFSSVFKNEGNVPFLTAVAQDQAEIIRVTTKANTQAVSADSKGFSETVSLSVGTDQQKLLTFLTTSGVKLSTKTLGLGLKASTDQSLAAATQASNYDETFGNIMQNYLTDYANDLKAAFGNTQNGTEKSLLSDQYQDSQLLLQQLQTIQDSTTN
jgi:hypothetical protein